MIATPPVSVTPHCVCDIFNGSQLIEPVCLLTSIKPATCPEQTTTFLLSDGTNYIGGELDQDIRIIPVLNKYSNNRHWLVVRLKDYYLDWPDTIHVAGPVIKVSNLELLTKRGTLSIRNFGSSVYDIMPKVEFPLSNEALNFIFSCNVETLNLLKPLVVQVVQDSSHQLRGPKVTKYIISDGNYYCECLFGKRGYGDVLKVFDLFIIKSWSFISNTRSLRIEEYEHYRGGKHVLYHYSQPKTMPHAADTSDDEKKPDCNLLTQGFIKTFFNNEDGSLESFNDEYKQPKLQVLLCRDVDIGDSRKTYAFMSDGVFFFRCSFFRWCC